MELFYNKGVKLSAWIAAVFLFLPQGLSAANLRARHREVKKMEIKSSAFSMNQPIPKKYTGEGEDVSPDLEFLNVPEKAKSLALIMDDPDAPPGTWIHWVIYNLPKDTRHLPENFPKKEALKDGTKQGPCWGVDSFERVGYYGPMPPPGKPHHYFFKLFALDKTLDIKPSHATKNELLKAMKGHILASAELVGVYQR